MIEQAVSQTSNAITEHNFLDLAILIEHRIMRGIIVGCTRATQQQFAVVVENIVDVFTTLSGCYNFACGQVIYFGLQFGNLAVHCIQSLLQFFQCGICLCHFGKHLCHLALTKNALAVSAFAFVLPIIDHILCGQFCCTGSQPNSCQSQIGRHIVVGERGNDRFGGSNSRLNANAAGSCGKVAEQGNDHIAIQRFIYIGSTVNRMQRVTDEIMPVDPCFACAECDG